MSTYSDVIDDDAVEERQSVVNLVQEIQDEMQSFLKDEDESSSENQEFVIQTNRILHILDITIKKIKIVFCLPSILRDGNIAKHYFKTYELYKIYDLLKDFGSDKQNASQINLQDQLLKINPKIARFIHILWTSKILEILPKYYEKLPDNDKRFIESLEEFRSLTEWRLKMTAPKEVAREKVLHRLWSENEKTKKKIKIVKENLEAEEKKYQEILSEKYRLIENSKSQLMIIKRQNEEDIKNILYDSTKEMSKICKNSEIEQEKISKEAKYAKEAYEKAAMENKKQEKKLREKKFKVQQQLKVWLNKYDNDIGEKTRELNKLNDDYEKEKTKYNQIKIEYDEQEIIYNALMVEKDLEEKRILEERLIAFVLNRAAKIIQRFYRKILSKRKSKGKGKGKGKKGKGKKK